MAARAVTEFDVLAVKALLYQTSIIRFIGTLISITSCLGNLCQAGNITCQPRLPNVKNPNHDHTHG